MRIQPTTDIIMSIISTPENLIKRIAEQARARRLDMEYTQEGLAKRADVSYGTLKKFERTGRISLESLLKIALVLDALDDFKALFVKKAESYASLDELLKEKQRPKRGKIR